MSSTQPYHWMPRLQIQDVLSERSTFTNYQVLWCTVPPTHSSSILNKSTDSTEKGGGVYVSAIRLTFSLWEAVQFPFHLILSNYGECYQKERNAKYVWSAQLRESSLTETAKVVRDQRAWHLLRAKCRILQRLSVWLWMPTWRAVALTFRLWLRKLWGWESPPMQGNIAKKVCMSLRCMTSDMYSVIFMPSWGNLPLAEADGDNKCFHSLPGPTEDSAVMMVPLELRFGGEKNIYIFIS